MTPDLTVLVIGAGANADFKFNTKKKNEENREETIAMPTGEELVKKIADWEGEVLPNLIYGYIYEEAKKLNLSNYNIFEDVSNFLINGRLKYQGSDWVDGAKLNQDSGTPTWNERRKLCKAIDWNLENQKFNKDWTLNKIEKSNSFSIYFKISQIVKHYQPFSIDEMLDSIKIGKVDISRWSDDNKESRESLIRAGKDLIALFLLQSEDERVFDYEASCWYRHLRNAIITCGKNTAEIEKKLEDFVIISFNYDRSLDYFLRTRVGEFYKKIRVIYPYGSLAEKEVWDVDKKDYQKIPYGSAKNETAFEKKWRNFEQAKELAKDLKVIGELEEDVDGKEKIKQMQECMKIFGAVYFLGFAFHKENCRIMGLDEKRFEGSRLGFMRALKTNTVFYTNFGNSDKIKEGFNSFFNSVEARKESDWRQIEREKEGKKREDFFEIGRDSKKGTYDALALDFDFKL